MPKLLTRKMRSNFAAKMQKERLCEQNTLFFLVWFRGGVTLGLVHELFESGIKFIYSTIELFLEVVHFHINEKNVTIHFLFLILVK
jgi:hypothetical protein